MSFLGFVLLIIAPSIHAQTCGGRIELTPSEPTASFHAPNYPDPQTFTARACRWVFVAPNSESITLHCPVISTLRRCRRNKIIYIQSGRRERLCGEQTDVERTTTADRFALSYSYRTRRETTTTGFTCTALASFAPAPPDPVTPPTDPVSPPTDPVTLPTDPTTPPTDPTTPPTDPATPPTDPTTPPTDPVTPPTDPVSPPTDPVAPPTDPTTPPTDPAPQCSCGGENLESRIVGGENAIIHQFPWMVRLIISNAFLCGASLISDEWILTAAHCVDGSTQASDITAYIGDHDMSTNTETANTITVQGIDLVVHPNWNSGTTDNDIALIKISPITLTREISPICLPFNRKDLSGKVGRVSGWGTTSSGGSISNILQWVQVNLLTAQQCRDGSSYGSSQITDNMICGEDSGKDSCQGDSGGPLFLKEDGYNFEVGVVSWGRGCALANYPGVYADVQVFTDWIEETTRETFCKSKTSVTRTRISKAN